MKDGEHMINLNEYESIETHWKAHYVGASNHTIYFDSFGVEHIPKKIKKFIGARNIAINIFSIQAYVLIMCGYLYWSFILICQ